jgi:DNA-directed RNA polymerase subunit beta
VAKAGEKITARKARELAEAGVKEVLVSSEDLSGRYIGEDVVDLESGQIYAEAGDELDPKLLAEIKDQKIKEFQILDIDHVNIGPFIRNTLHIDKNSNHQEALMDIYRVMRPGEPPTIEAATALFHSLFFDSERYDLSAVGRVKMNMRLELDAPDTMRSLRRWLIFAMAVAKSTISTTSATAVCVRSASSWRTSTAWDSCAWSAPSRNACRPSTSTR